MTTPFYSASCKAGSGVQPRAGIALCSVTGSYDFIAAFVDEDIVKLVKIPKGATIIDVIMAVPALTNQADVVWAVGDDQAATDAANERFITGATKGRSSAGGVDRLNVPSGHGYKYTVDANIIFHITTVPGATAVTSGTITLTVLYTMDP
jgi:hypothetical protein